MAIIRQAHTKQFVCLSNKLAQNNKLSLRARGLMAYLLSLPDHWQVHINHLVKEMKEGRHVIRETLQELKEAGYVHHLKLGFKDGWQYFVFEDPHTEEQFKEFLRTIRFSNSSDSEQFEDRPLDNTNSPRNPLPERNPPLTPPEEKKPKREEEDFSSKRKDKIQRIAEKWAAEGRPQKVIDRTVQKYYEQPRGEVKNIPRWMETVYEQQKEAGEGDELFEMRRKFARKRENEQRSNYFYCVKKDLLCYTSGTTETPYKIKGAEEFWSQQGLGQIQFAEWKEKQGSNHVA